MPAIAMHPILTPQGHLLLAPADEAPPLPVDLQQRLSDAFERGAGHGLLQLGAGEVGTALPAAFNFWREFGGRYVTALCTTPAAAVATPSADELAALAAGAPPMAGAEYLNARTP